MTETRLFANRALYLPILLLLLLQQVEEVFRANKDVVIPASRWPTAKDDLEMDLVQMLKDQASNVSAWGEGGMV